MTSNFAFLTEKFPSLAQLGRLAETYCTSDPNSCLIKLGMMGETMVNLMYRYDGIPFPAEEDNAARRINGLYREGLLTQEMQDLFHLLRKARNKAVHENLASAEAGARLLPVAYGLAEWFMQTYGDYRYEHRPFVMPAADVPAAAAPAVIPKAEKEKREAEENGETERLQRRETERAAAVAPKTPDAQRKGLDARRRKSRINAQKRTLTEAETRVLIDEALREVGWDADSTEITWARGARPQKGKNQAIAEWPCEGKHRADYALFLGLDLVGLIEAKAIDRDVSAILGTQGKEYARTVLPAGNARALGQWGAYRVPVIFAANGRPYLAQYEEASGVWFQDLRGHGAPRALKGWMSPDGLRDYLAADAEKGNQSLRALPFDFLRDRDGLALRDYQVSAIEAVERAVLGGKKTALLAMATGTGKTRTVLGLLYRLLKTGRFRRALFLIDRTALGDQAMDVFQTVRLEENKPLTGIYDVKSLGDRTFERATRLQIATVQGMIQRILYAEDRRPAVTDYDLIVVDEAHRGYFLDRDMTGLEYECRDQRDYQSKYRYVLDYFDAVKVGLTATPALQTTEIFGLPVYTYSYRDAVIDGYLADHDAPHIIRTELGSEGIHYRKGDDMQVLDLDTHRIETIENLPDEIDFDIEDFNRKVITRSFNEAVLHEIARDLNPTNEKRGKTLIYAANDRHADLIVDILKKYYEAQDVPEEAIQKITSRTGGGDPRRVEAAVRAFRNEKFPSIAVTVDLLTTGIDVPAITTLVFLRRVKSRILYEQMLGRATRLCADIGKDHFEIYDAVGVTEMMRDVTTMPVVAVPADTFATLVDQLAAAEKEDDRENLISRVRARLVRKARRLTDAARDDFEDAAGSAPEDFAKSLKGMTPAAAREAVLAIRDALRALDAPGSTGPASRPYLVVDGHEDRVIEHIRKYGATDDPEDYLRAFADWVETHRNDIDAMHIICTRPKDLTLDALRRLKTKLDAAGFSERQLNTAASEMTHRDTAASLIGFIRRAALGSPLESHSRRVAEAAARLKAAHDFTAAEKDWIDRMAAVLVNDSVLNADTFDKDRRFASCGGFRRINEKIFGNRLADVISELNDYVYDDKGRRA